MKSVKNCQKQKRKGVFDDFSEAFAYCREADRPVRVMISGTRYKLFPSGRAERLSEVKHEVDGR